MWQYGYSNELYHYGVLGMKWGVRKNKKTERNKRSKLKVVDMETSTTKEIISLFNEGYDFYMKDKTKLYRSTTAKDEQVSGSKYVSARKEDILTYVDMVGNGHPEETIYTDTYETNKKIKVAGERVQAEILSKMKGKNSKEDPRIQSLIDKGWIKKELLDTPISKMENKEFTSFMYYNLNNIDMDILNKPVTNLQKSQFVDALQKKGYTAAVDMTDTSVSFSYCPLVIFDTDKQLTKIESKVA